MECRSDNDPAFTRLLAITRRTGVDGPEGRSVTCTWAELLGWLAAPWPSRFRWSPVYDPAFGKAAPAERSVALSCLVLDGEFGTALEALPIALLAYEYLIYLLPAPLPWEPRYRLVLPLARPLELPLARPLEGEGWPELCGAACARLTAGRGELRGFRWIELVTASGLLGLDARRPTVLCSPRWLELPEGTPRRPLRLARHAGQWLHPREMRQWLRAAGQKTAGGGGTR